MAMKSPMRLIKKYAHRIAQKCHPQRIILFGSYARGKIHADSDVDLLVILPGKKKAPDMYREISKIFEPRPFPLDLLIRSHQEIRHRLKIGDSFIQEILKNGKVLYES